MHSKKKTMHLLPSDQSMKINSINELHPGQTNVWSSWAAVTESKEAAPVAVALLDSWQEQEKRDRNEGGSI